MFKKYYIKVNKLFVFQCFSNVFKEGFCKVKRDSLGLAERDKVDEKKEVISEKAYKL